MKLKISLLFVIFAFVFPATASANIIFVDADFVENDCSIIGIWNTLTQTCTMNRDVVGRIVLVDTGTTLDGNGHTLSSNEDTRYGTGVEIFRADRITVKNLHVSDFSSAITAYTPPNEPRGDLVTLKDNSITESERGIDVYHFDRFVVVGNTITSSGVPIGVTDGERGRVADNVIACPSNTCSADISLSLVSSSNIVSNQITGGNIGFDLGKVSDLSFADNTISETLTALSMVADSTTLRNIFFGNTFRDSGTGVKISHDGGGGGPVLSLASKFFDFLVPSALALSDDDNIFFHNDFIHNTQDVSADSSDFFRFSKLAPDGGNFWDKNTDCADTDTDGFCDTPYLVDLGVYDELPLTHSISAITPPPTVLTLTNPTETEDDGNQDTKGVADKTNFTFSVTAEGTLDSVKVIATSTTDTFILNLVQNADIYTTTSTFPKGHYTYHFEATSGADTVKTADQVFTTGYSNVAFLPGLEASRLYRPEVLSGTDEDQLWEPTRNQDVEELYLDPITGESVGSNIYTRDVIGSAYGLMNIYSSFIEFMDGLKTDGTIHDWEKLPYDWRFDYEKLLTSGKKTGENISYLEATSTPFILQELRRLAEDSDTGKVTVITHSNGGLVAKYLLKKLELENDPLLPNIDKLIMVAAPQIGTPGAIEGLLHGDEQQIGIAINKTDFGMLMDEEHSRELGENMQSAYNLLPSKKYFETVQSPVIKLEPNDPITHTFSTLYGEMINTPDELRNFLLGDPQSGSLRIEPAPDDEESPNVLKQRFLDRATENHDTMIDDWAPPASMEVVQIAGWGIKTLSGIHYSCGLLTCSSLSTLDRDILQTHVGDGTVVIPSALYMSTSTPNVERRWVNMQKYNDSVLVNRDHSDILEIKPLRDFIKNIIKNTRTLESHITTTAPILSKDDIALDFRLHSPVALHLYDNEGNHTGRIPNPIPGSDFRAYEARLPNSYYREYGETKYAGADTFATTTIKLVGEALGSFTFDIDETLGDTLVASTTWKDIPVTASSTLTLDIQTLTSPAVLLMDVDGDGITDTALAPGDGVTEQEFIAILKGIVKTLNLPVQKETKLLKKVEKLEKELAKEHKNEKQEKRKTAKVFEEVIKQIKKFEKKGLLTAGEASELLEVVAKIQASVVK